MLSRMLAGFGVYLDTTVGSLTESEGPTHIAHSTDESRSSFSLT